MNKLNGRYVFGVATLAIAAILAVTGLAAAEPPVRSVVDGVETVFNGGFSPKVLSKTKPTPVVFSISGKIRRTDGSHPPALKEFLLEGDKHAGISVKGIPTCTAGKLNSRTTEQARKICAPALVGTGKTEVGIKFAETPNDVLAKSDLLVFNGGVSGGVTTLFIHAYITVPTPAAVVTTVKIKKIHKGRFGLLSVASIPKIAGGLGSVKSFSLKLNKGIVSATCPDGHLNARGTAIFAEGLHISGEVERPCTGKG
jgi:hypothetical protein